MHWLTDYCREGALPLAVGFLIKSKRGWKISKTTSLRPGSFRRFWDVLSNLLLNEAASLFSLSTHWLLPLPNRVIDAGKQPSGGKFVTPILLAPSPYRVCHENMRNAIEQIKWFLFLFFYFLGECKRFIWYWHVNSRTSIVESLSRSILVFML